MVSPVRVSAPQGMTTVARDALGTSLKVGTEIFNSDTGRYEITQDGGITWQVSAFISDISTGSGGLNDAYLIGPTITLDGQHAVTIQNPSTSSIAYNAPISGAVGGSSIQGFVFVPTVNGFITSMQYNDLFFPSGTRLVEVYVRHTQTLLMSTPISKSSRLVSGFRTEKTLFPVYMQAGLEYVISVVVPTGELYNTSTIAPISPITITNAAFTTGATLPAFPSSFLAGSVPRAGGFEFVRSIDFRSTTIENSVSINNNFLEMVNSNTIYNTLLDTFSNFGSDIKCITNATAGGIPINSACKASAAQDLSIEIVGNADPGDTGIICIAANSTNAVNQIQKVWGLQIVKLIAAGNIVHGDKIRKATGVGNSGRVISSGISSGTFAVSLQTVTTGQTLIAALMLSTA